MCPSRNQNIPISKGPSLRGVRRRALELPAPPFSLLELELPDVSQKSPLLELLKSSPELDGVPKRALEPPGVICRPTVSPPISCIDSDRDLGKQAWRRIALAEVVLMTHFADYVVF